MIDQQTVEAIRDRAEIKDVVEDYVQLQRRGVNYVGLCPFHDDRRPSFYVSPAKNFCHCFVCGGGGNPISFVMKMENITFVEALKKLADKYNIPIQEKELTAEERQRINERETLQRASEWLNKQFIQNLNETDEGKETGISYLMSALRFRQDTIAKFQLGYALAPPESYTRLAEQKGAKVEYLVRIGASIKQEDGTVTDRFAGRLIFPIYSASGQVSAFAARSMNSEEPMKYIFSAENFRSYSLFGLNQAKKAILKEKKCYVAADYCDVVSLSQAGVENVVGSCGPSLSEEQCKLIGRVTPAKGSEEFEQKQVVLLVDGNETAKQQAFANGKLLLGMGFCVNLVQMPQGLTPDTFAQQHSGDDVAEYMVKHEEDFIMFLANHYANMALTSPTSRQTSMAEIINVINSIPNPIMKSVYKQECIGLQGVDQRMLSQYIIV